MNDEEFMEFVLTVLCECAGGDPKDAKQAWSECSSEDKKSFAKGAKKIIEKAKEMK